MGALGKYGDSMVQSREVLPIRGAEKREGLAGDQSRDGTTNWADDQSQRFTGRMSGMDRRLLIDNVKDNIVSGRALIPIDEKHLEISYFTVPIEKDGTFRVNGADFNLMDFPEMWHLWPQYCGTAMSDEELDEMANFASHLYDKFNLNRMKNSPRELYILGFIKGRSFTLHQLGVFEPEEEMDDDVELPEILKQYLEFEAQKG